MNLHIAPLYLHILLALSDFSNQIDVRRMDIRISREDIIYTDDCSAVVS